MIGILIILIAYLLFVFVILRLFVPNLGFKKSPLTSSIPEDLENQIKKMNMQAKDDLDFLRQTYEYITGRYYGRRVETILMFWYAFETVLEYKPGYLPCTSLNYLIRIFLIKSGRFTEDDIKIKTVPLNLFIHQYLEVKVNGEWIFIDPWSAHLGIPFGKHSFLFAL